MAGAYLQESHKCINCCTVLGQQTKWQYPQCKAAKYCSVHCQKAHWGRHKSLCHVIKRVEEFQNAKQEKQTMFASHLTPVQKTKIAKLVGEQCTIKCRIEDREFDALWDMGAQVSIVSKEWVDTNLPDKKIQNINELLGVELELVAANGTKIPYLGFIEVKFQLAKSEGFEVLQVPILVTPKPQLLPLIGFNVIQETVNEGSDKEASVSTIDVMKETFQSSDETNMENLVHLIHETDEANTWFGSVRTIKKDFVLLRGQSTKIHCRANYIAVKPRTPVIFEPDTLLLPEGIEITESLFDLKRGSSRQLNLEVHNVTNQDIVLPRRTPLGSLQSVKSVTLVEVV